MTGAGLIRADAVAIPLRDNSVDLIVTSPPYFALRSYTDGGEHYDGQIGSEPTPQAFLEALWAVTAECRRVLKPSGSLWVNLGDKYAGGGQGGHTGATLAQSDEYREQRAKGYGKKKVPFRDKSLMGLPWRYAIGCIDQLDLILRAEVVWSKPNGLPESVTDRVRRSHEQWFMFTKEPRYFAAVDEIRESRSNVVESPPQHLPGCPLFVGPPDSLRPRAVRRGHEGVGGVELFDLSDEMGSNQRVERHHVPSAEQEHEIWSGGASVPLAVGRDSDLGADATNLLNDGVVPAVDVQAQVGRTDAAVAQGHRPFSVDDPGQPGKVCTCGHATYHTAGLGKLPGSVWTVPSEPLRVPEWLGVDHFAAFPQELVRRIILGWSPSGICVECGEGRRPVVHRPTTGQDNNPDDRKAIRVNGGMGGTAWRRMKAEAGGDRITGYACACPTPDAPTRPAVVLDPFGGTGTVAMVARALGRYGVHIDLSADYLRLANWRVFQSGHAAKAAARTNAERQGDLFGGAA